MGRVRLIRISAVVSIPYTIPYMIVESASPPLLDTNVTVTLHFCSHVMANHRSVHPKKNRGVMDVRKKNVAQEIVEVINRSYRLFQCKQHFIVIRFIY